jgi:hypothetical protein
MIRIACEFGFTPASRSRLPTTSKSDPWLEIPSFEDFDFKTVVRLSKPHIASNHSHEPMLHETIKGSSLARSGNAGGNRAWDRQRRA